MIELERPRMAFANFISAWGIWDWKSLKNFATACLEQKSNGTFEMVLIIFFLASCFAPSVKLEFVRNIAV